MDTKWKKRSIVLSFAAFFLGVSLMIGNGVLLLGQALDADSAGNPGISGLFEKDYQNTAQFRRFLQGRLSSFLAIGSESGNIGGYFDAEGAYWQDEADLNGTYTSGIADAENEGAKQAADAYHEAVKKDKNLLYQVMRDGVVLYSNMEGGRWENDGSTYPSGYNFFLHFDGEKVTVVKDKKERDLYGDGYYRDASQWYVPGYRNFTADEAMKKVEVMIFAVKDPVSYSYVKYEEGGFGQTDSRLYEIFQEVRQNHEKAVWSAFGFVVGAVLLTNTVMLSSVRRRKKAADRGIAAFLGRIWFEGKLIVVLAMAAGVLKVAGSQAFAGADVLREWTGFGTVSQGTRYFEKEEALDGDQDVFSAEGNYLEEAVSETDLQDDVRGFDLPEEPIDTGGLWMEWEESPAVWEWLGRFLSSHPLYVLLYVWLCYFLLLDLIYHKSGFFDGAVQKLLRRARTDSLKQPFAVAQVRRAAAGAAAAIAACAALMLVTVLFGAGFFSKTETAVIQCIIFAVLLAVFVRSIGSVRQQAEELDLLAAQIQTAQSAGAAAQEHGFAEDSRLKPLSDGIAKIRQGMEAAVFEQLKSERMKVELVANVSHDLKTPLTSIISYLSFLKQEEGLPEHVQDYIRILDQKAGRLNSIVQDVFAVSQAASGELSVELKVLDYTKLLHQTLADMQEQILKAPATVKAELPPQPVRIRADGSRLYRVFQNLLQNALQYSLEGSRIYVTLQEEGGYAFACVKNTSRQELRNGADFTERFVRGDESRTDGGAGLGLSIAKSFTEACGGTFALETDADLFAVTVGFAVVLDADHS